MPGLCSDPTGSTEQLAECDGRWRLQGSQPPSTLGKPGSQTFRLLGPPAAAQPRLCKGDLGGPSGPSQPAVLSAGVVFWERVASSRAWKSKSQTPRKYSWARSWLCRCYSSCIRRRRRRPWRCALIAASPTNTPWASVAFSSTRTWCRSPAAGDLRGGKH